MSNHFGYIPQDRRTQAVQTAWEQVFATLPRRVFGNAARNLAGSGAGKVALLWKCVEQLSQNPLMPWDQNPAGTCVSFGYAMAVTVLKAVEIVLGSEHERWVAPVATEPIYALSRVEVGNGQAGRGDGSLGAWAAKAVRTYGVLMQQQYGQHDLSQYDYRRARAWGAPGAGLPDDLEPLAAEHLVETTSLVTTWEQTRDALANGYPVPVCSTQGFEPAGGKRRDAQGFAKPNGRWDHCMCFIAVDDDSKRPGALCINSWGASWISGPRRHAQPEGSFWVDAEVVERMVRQGDTFALSRFQGFPNRNFDFTAEYPNI
ncbi:MAG: hypothetical protein AB7O38_29920 [Pirellulaceae bacterium]